MCIFLLNYCDWKEVGSTLFVFGDNIKDGIVKFFLLMRVFCWFCEFITLLIGFVLLKNILFIVGIGDCVVELVELRMFFNVGLVMFVGIILVTLELSFLICILEVFKVVFELIFWIVCVVNFKFEVFMFGRDVRKLELEFLFIFVIDGGVLLLFNVVLSVRLIIEFIEFDVVIVLFINDFVLLIKWFIIVRRFVFLNFDIFKFTVEEFVFVKLFLFIECGDGELIRFGIIVSFEVIDVFVINYIIFG